MTSRPRPALSRAAHAPRSAAGHRSTAALWLAPVLGLLLMLPGWMGVANAAPGVREVRPRALGNALGVMVPADPGVIADDGASATHASRVAAAPPMTVHVGSRLVEWRAPDGTSVSGTVLRDGSVVATGSGYSHQGGPLMMGFTFQGDRSPPSDAPLPRIRPGDVVRLQHEDGGATVEAVVPPLTAAISEDGASIEGETDAGDEVLVEWLRADDWLETLLWASHFDDDAWEHLEPEAPRPEDRVLLRAGDDGRWSARVGGARLQRGDFAWTRVRDEAGHAFVRDLAVPAIYLREDGTVLAVGNSATRRRLELLRPAGDPTSTLDLEIWTQPSHWGYQRRYLPFGGGFLEREDLASPLADGDRLRVTGQSADGRPLPALELDLPRLTSEVLPDGSLGGHAPADATIWLGLRGPDEQAQLLRTKADKLGAWHAEPPFGIGPGWLRSVAAHIGDGEVLLMRTEGEPLIRVMPGSPFVAVRVPPGEAGPRRFGSMPVTATLYAASGELLALDVGILDYDDSPRALLRLSHPQRLDIHGQPLRVSIEPGQRLEVELNAGDPHTLHVPDFDAGVDGGGELVEVVAAPFAEITFTVNGGMAWPGRYYQPVAQRQVLADANGRASIALDELLPDAEGLAHPRWGIASQRLQGGFELATGFGTPQLQISLGSGEILIDSPMWQPVRVDLSDAEGRLRAVNGAMGTLPAERERWRLATGSDDSTWRRQTLVDELGAPVAPRFGDRLVVRAGAARWERSVPRLEALVFAEQDVVEGQGPPGTSLRLSSRSAGTDWEREVTADAAGRFRLDLGAENIDLRWGDHVALRTSQDGLTLLSQAVAPGLVVDLDRGLVETEIGGGEEAQARVLRGGSILVDTELRAQPSGALRWLPSADGAAWAPREGDRLELRLPALDAELPEDGGLETGLRVPRLEIEIDADDGELRVLGEPGAQVIVAAPTELGISTNDFVDLPPDGHLRLRGPDGGALPLAPDMVISVRMRLPEGHVALRQRALPALSLPMDASLVCGWTEPGAAVAIQALRDGRTRARAEGAADALGRFALELVDETGARRALGAGDRVRATIGAQAYDTTMVDFDAKLDWSRNVLVARAPPGTSGGLSQLQRPGCRDDAEHVDGYPLAFDELGHATSPFLDWLRVAIDSLGAEAIFEVWLDRPGGVRQYRLLRDLRVSAHVDRALVEGEANAGQAVEARLEDASGGARAEALVVADSDGLWALRMRDAAGEDVLPRPGDRLRVSRADEEALIEIEPFGFDLVGERLIGRALPYRPVALRFALDPALFGGRLPGEPPFEQGLWIESEADGRFELPLRSEGGGWDAGDLIGIRAARRLESRHELIAAWTRPADVGPTPKRAYLPLAIR